MVAAETSSVPSGIVNRTGRPQAVAVVPVQNFVGSPLRTRLAELRQRIRWNGRLEQQAASRGESSPRNETPTIGDELPETVRAFSE